MHRFTWALVALALVPAVHAEPSPAEKMTVIAAPSWRDMANTEKRFGYVLPRFVSMCADLDRDSRAADMLVFTWQKLEEAGLGGEEGLLSVSNTLFGLTTSLSAMGGTYARNMKCAEIFTMYLSARLGGTSVKESKDGVYELIRTLAVLIR